MSDESLHFLGILVYVLPRMLLLEAMCGFTLASVFFRHVWYIFHTMTIMTNRRLWVTLDYAPACRGALRGDRIFNQCGPHTIRIRRGGMLNP